MSKRITKPDVIKKLEELGIEHDPKANLQTLKALIPEDQNIGGAGDASDDDVDIDGIDVADPEILKPVELPLVIKPSKGRSWENDEQAEYARYLNAYAYKNPKKWRKKKKALLDRLVAIGKDPELLSLYRGGDGAGVSYVDHRISLPEGDE